MLQEEYPHLCPQEAALPRMWADLRDAAGAVAMRAAGPGSLTLPSSSMEGQELENKGEQEEPHCHQS